MLSNVNPRIFLKFLRTMAAKISNIPDIKYTLTLKSYHDT